MTGDVWFHRELELRKVVCVIHNPDPRPPPLLGHCSFVKYILLSSYRLHLVLLRMCLHWRYSTLKPAAIHEDTKGYLLSLDEMRRDVQHVCI